MKYNQTLSNVENEIATADFRTANPYSEHRRNFLLIKSNRTHLLSDNSEPTEFYSKLLLHQKLTVLESMQLPEILDSIEIVGNLEPLTTKKPAIYAAFHLGSFHSWIYLFSKYNLPFTTIVNQQSFDNKSEIESNLTNMNAKLGTNSDIQFLQSEDSRVAVNMIRELKNGRNLLIFVDGNSGVGGNSRVDDKLDKIEFLGSEYYVRTGIAAISHLTGCPIIPILSYRENGKIYQNIMNALLPDQSLERKEFSHQTTQELYTLFSPFLLRYPEQWESWLYINNFIRPKEENIERLQKSYNETPNLGIRFNHSRYSLLAENNKFFLYDTFQYRLFTISSVLFELLYNFPDDIQHKLGENLLNDLKINEVILF